MVCVLRGLRSARIIFCLKSIYILFIVDRRSLACRKTPPRPNSINALDSVPFIFRDEILARRFLQPKIRFDGKPLRPKYYLNHRSSITVSLKYYLRRIRVVNHQRYCPLKLLLVQLLLLLLLLPVRATAHSARPFTLPGADGHAQLAQDGRHGPGHVHHSRRSPAGAWLGVRVVDDQTSTVASLQPLQLVASKG